MTEEAEMKARLIRLRRTAAELHGAARTAFEQYREAVGERKRLRGEINRLQHAQEGRKANERDKAALQDVARDLEAAEAEFVKAEQEYHQAQERWNAAGQLVTSCEEWLDQQGGEIE